MADLHHALAQAAALAQAPPRCWHCGHPLAPDAGAMAVCADGAACGVRAVTPPPGHPARGGHTMTAPVLTFTLAPRWPDDRCYTVTLDGRTIGLVYRSTESIERRPHKGARYVSARWERPCWRWDGGRVPYPTRDRAAKAMVRASAEGEPIV